MSELALNQKSINLTKLLINQWSVCQGTYLAKFTVQKTHLMKKFIFNKKSIFKLFFPSKINLNTGRNAKQSHFFFCHSIWISSLVQFRIGLIPLK